MINEWITMFKEILDIDPNKRSMILSWIFLSLIIWYLWFQNGKLIEKLDGIEAKMAEDRKQAQTDCYEQIKINRERDQAQINSFIERSNAERDSIYRSFHVKIRTYNQRVSKGIKELNDIQDEIRK